MLIKIYNGYSNICDRNNEKAIFKTAPVRIVIWDHYGIKIYTHCTFLKFAPWASTLLKVYYTLHSTQTKMMQLQSCLYNFSKLRLNIFIKLRNIHGLTLSNSDIMLAEHNNFDTTQST